MPSFVWSRAMVANELAYNPLTGWQFERVPSAFVRGAYIAILQRATGTTVRQSIFTGSQNIMQRSAVQTGGTGGVTPVSFTTPVVDFRSTPDDKLTIEDDEVGGLTPTVDGIITIEPL